jgi:hypothetical protein
VFCGAGGEIIRSQKIEVFWDMMPCRLSKEMSAFGAGGGNWSFCIQGSSTTVRRV